MVFVFFAFFLLFIPQHFHYLYLFLFLFYMLNSREKYIKKTYAHQKKIVIFLSFFVFFFFFLSIYLSVQSIMILEFHRPLLRAVVFVSLVEKCNLFIKNTLSLSLILLINKGHKVRNQAVRNLFVMLIRLTINSISSKVEYIMLIQIKNSECCF